MAPLVAQSVTLLAVTLVAVPLVASTIEPVEAVRLASPDSVAIAPLWIGPPAIRVTLPCKVVMVPLLIDPLAVRSMLPSPVVMVPPVIDPPGPVVRLMPPACVVAVAMVRSSVPVSDRFTVPAVPAWTTRGCAAVTPRL